MLDRATVAEGLLGEYDHYLALLRDIAPPDEAKGTRCGGWTVHDVLGHVVGLASDSFAGRVGRFTPDQQAEMRRDLTAADLADELDQALLLGAPLLRQADDEQWAGPSGAPDLTLGEGVLTLWFDAWVHRDDVRAALGQEPDAGRGLDAAFTYVRWALDRAGWQPPAGVDVDGLDRYTFVLAATGRAAPEPLGLDPSVNLYR